jgi:hypothetical protein
VPLQIVEAVRLEMPAAMPLFLRVSSVDGAQEGWNMDDTVAFARELKMRGVDVVDFSSGGISGAATAAQVPRSLGFQVPFAERVRKVAKISTMAVGIILEAQQAEAILENGHADLGSQLVATRSTIPTSPIIGHTISASTLASSTGRRSMAGGLRSGSERWMVLRRRPAPLFVAHENRAGGTAEDRAARHPGFVCL